MTSLFNYLQKIPHHSSDSSGASEVNSAPQPLGFNLMGVSNLAKTTFPILVTGSALIVATSTSVAAQSVTYDNTTSATINSNTCGSSPIVRTFNVTDNFTVQDVNLGFNADHTWRGDIRVTLQHPDGTSVEVISNTGGSADGFDVLLDSDSGNSLDDGDNDDIAAPLYDRTVAPSNSLAVFNGKTSIGTWTLEICDSVGGDEGTFNSARLVLDGTALPIDYGDAPDTTASTGSGDYQTLSANSGPSHTIDNTTYLGAGVTADTDGFGDGTDTNNNATDDTDDGVLLNTATLQGQEVTTGTNLTLDITTAGSGVLNAWIDWNSDGDFNDTGEQIATDVSPTGNAIALNVTVPAGASVGTTYARFRYSSDTGLSPTGAASDGEVEDYQITLAPSISNLPPFACSPDFYQTRAINGQNFEFLRINLNEDPVSFTVINTLTAFTSGTGEINAIGYNAQDNYIYAIGVENTDSGQGARLIRLGSNGAHEIVGPLIAAADYPAQGISQGDPFPDDFLPAGSVDGTGHLYVTGTEPIYKINISTQTYEVLDPGAGLGASDWAYNPRDGKFYAIANRTNELKIYDPATNSITTETLIGSAIPSFQGGAFIDPTGTFYSLVNRSGPSTGNFALYKVDLQTKVLTLVAEGDQQLNKNDATNCAEAFVVDYGDAPDSYQTAFSSNGPRHMSDPTVLGLGNTSDPETDATVSADASGDGADEDGVASFSSLDTAMSSYSVDVNVTNNSNKAATLIAWIDFDGNGTFEADEVSTQTIAANSGTSTASLNWSNIGGAGGPDIQAGTTFARFRITTNPITSTDVGGGFLDGEVEDYEIAIADSTPTTASVGDKVWEDLDGDGIQDAVEPGIPNALVNIYKSDNTLVDATFTDSNGDYSFSDLDPGDYIIEFTSPAVGYNFTSQDAGDDTLDSDADPVTGRTATFTLAAGDNNTSIDAGLTLKANTIVACDVIPRQRTDWTETLNVQKFDSAQGSLARVDLTLSTLIAQELIYENTADQPKTITVNQDGQVSVSLPDTNANFTRNYNQSTEFNLPAFDGSDDFSGTSGGTTPTSLAYETHTEEYTNLADFITSSSPETLSIEVNTTSGASFINSDNATTGATSQATVGLCATYTYSLIPEEASPEAGNIVINEVLYAQTGTSADTNDEFIELYNASDNAVDISNWRLADSNLIFNSTDNTGNITGDAANPAYIFPNNTTLQPGEYAVIWIGNNTSDHQAADAAFQDWLGNAAKLNNAGEDVWLYDDELKIVDYIAYGSNNAINTPPSAGLNLWDDTYQGDLDGAATGQSISLTPNGEDGNTSACWEHTLSNDADGRCPEFLETRDTDTVSVRQTSVGVYNNILPNVILVKRITAIKPKDTNQWIELPESGSPFIDGIDGGSSENNVNSDRAADDNDPNWPNPDVYLRGLINSGQVMPGDELEYTVYFLSNGSNDAQNLRICDRVPGETTFIPDSFNATAGFPSSDVGIAMFQSNTSLPNGGLAEPNIFLTNIPDSDRGRYYGPNTSVPSGCNVTFNQNGVVVVEVGDVPNADSPGNPPNSYGFIRFRALVK